MSAARDVSGARDVVLARVRAALGGGAARAPVPPAAARAAATVTAGTAPPSPAVPSAVPSGDAAAAAAEAREALVRLLCERLGECGVEVRRTPPGGVAGEAEAVCRARRLVRLGVPVGLPAAWRPAGVAVVEDHGLSPRELDGLDGVLTGCTAAIAVTGTLLLTAGPADGRRALTLVPDVLVCVVEGDQVVADLPAALAVAEPLVRGERRPLTFVSGPSATSDIELHRVEGVHGPRQLVVLVDG